MCQGWLSGKIGEFYKVGLWKFIDLWIEGKADCGTAGRRTGRSMDLIFDE